jgi:hypothetical protein
VDNLDAPTHSLQYLEDSARVARDAIIGGFAMSIRISKFNLEKSLEDFCATLGRLAMAAQWDEETISVWEERGRNVCGSVLEEVDLVLKRAEDREADETRVRIMEASRDRLMALVDTEQDEPEEKDQD